MSKIRGVLSKIRLSLFKGAFVHNAILTQATGICAVIGAATGFRSSVVLSLLVGVILLFCETVTSLFLKNIPRWIRVALYALMSSAVICFAEPFILTLFKSVWNNTLPLYFYLLCVNALVTVRCERFACKRKLRYSIIDALSTAIGFGSVTIIIGVARELITYGTVQVFSDAAFRIPNGSLPFVAFILLGFLAALHKAYVIKFYPREQTDTFTFKGCDSKPVFKDPGIGKRKPAAISADTPEDDYGIIKPRYEQDDLNITEKEDENNG